MLLGLLERGDGDRPRGAEDAARVQGFGVLLYSFDDLAWCCFAVVAYWLRKYRWTVAHAVRVM